MATKHNGLGATPADALKQWRSAERATTVAGADKKAAHSAASAAEAAAEAAHESAAAAQLALDAATRAQKSAARTDVAARVVVQHSHADLADAESDAETATAAEAEAHARYREVAARAFEDAGNPGKKP